MSNLRVRLAALAISIIVLVLLGSCDDPPEPYPDSTSPSSPITPVTSAPTTSVISTSAPPAQASSAGSKQSQQAGPRPNLSAGGANAAPTQTNPRPWTAQKAADFLIENGLRYDSGVYNTVVYDECTGVRASYDPATRAYSEFDCYIETRETAPYWIKLSVTGEMSARFRFQYYAT